MSKFSGTTRRPVPANLHGPVTTTTKQTTTFEGGHAYSRTAESQLFVLAAANMVGESTFYEDAGTRDKRFVDLIHEVTRTNPAFIAGGTGLFVGPGPNVTHPRGLVDYLRRDLLMRSASVVLACEYVKAGGPRGRLAINAACQRPDEPAEVLGYWLSTHGRNVPMPVKRGVADAVRRLYNERAALRYDGQSRGLRMGDVIELVHPKPVDARQAALFKYLLDQRHHNDGDEKMAGWEDGVRLLPTLTADRALRRIEPDHRRSFLRSTGGALGISVAGWSWEKLSGWLPGGMDAEAWGWAIPNMGAMALVRNLRNFDQAGIPDSAVEAVIAKVTDEEEVKRARLFPFHAWQAYQAAPSDNWKRALGKTLDLTTRNVPEALDGSLVLVDVSGSMMGTLSSKSTLARWEVGAVLGAAVAHGTKNSDVVAFGTRNEKVNVPAGSSALRTVEEVSRILRSGHLDYGTNGHTALAAHWDPTRHRRAFIVTDDQMHDSVEPGGRSAYGSRGVSVAHVPLIYTTSLGGYAPSSLPSGDRGRYTLSGFSDSGFQMVASIEAGRDAHWAF